MEIDLDSSVLIALANVNDVHYSSCTSKFQSWPHKYHASVLAYTEALFLGFKESYEVALEAALELLERIKHVLGVDLDIANAALVLVSATGMSMIDSLICATSQIYGHQLWTCDKGIVAKFPQAKYIGA